MFLVISKSKIRNTGFIALQNPSYGTTRFQFIGTPIKYKFAHWPHSMNFLTRPIKYANTNCRKTRSICCIGPLSVI